MRLRRYVADMIKLAQTQLPADVRKELERASRIETSKIARVQLECMLKNLEVASEKRAPICQDTGALCFFVRGFQGDILKEIREGVRIASSEIPLRQNMVDPETSRQELWFSAYFEPGKEKGIDLLVRGAGAENWSRLYMLKPERLESVVDLILSLLKEAGGNACPPVIVGIGIGGTADVACLLSRKALLRPLDEPSQLGELEERIRTEANKLGIGPMGLGGKTTVLGVRALKAPCHRATLPVAISLQCWVARRAHLRFRGRKIEVFQ